MLDPVAVTKSPFQLRGSLFTLSVMQLYSCALDDIARELKMVIRQAPKFFEQAPIVLDLQQLPENSTPDFAALTQLIRDHGLIPVGIRNGSSEQNAAAKASKLAVLSNAKATEEPQLSTKQKPEQASEKSKPTQQETKPASPKTDGVKARRNILMSKPIRSGQQVYAKDGDLVVVGSVSAGAECLADGNIHIYGPLRGRALAGVNGDTTARIFCHSMEAELISVAGRYIVSETLQNQTKDVPQQIYLKDGKLTIENL